MVFCFGFVYGFFMIGMVIGMFVRGVDEFGVTRSGVTRKMWPVCKF